MNETSDQQKGGRIVPAPITSEMEKAYLDYAMSVIVARALPDVRDGLKPVHRRIIYAMKEQGIDANSRYQKSAAVVGEVLKKYHPHGDAALYEALVRMAQTFSLRYTLIQGQGNFGSIDGDSPAAMRYTECRLSRLSDELLKDIEKETVKFVDNYSGTDKEPTILPSALPNLLLNGASGIAVGLATNIPTHNLGEVIDASLELIKQSETKIKETKTLEVPPDYPFRYKRPEYHTLDFKSEATIEDLTQYIKGPDFPTGGIIYDWNEIVNAYATGRGSIITRAKAKIEEDPAGRGKQERFSIIVSELPYQVNKALLVAKIAELAKDKKIEGIADLRDESDRQGLRVVVELKRDARPQQILNNLYKHTEMQKVFHVNMVALINGEPRLLTLKNILEEFVSFRIEIVTRRTLFLLKKSREREHILEGLKIALDHLDAIIKTIRQSRDGDEAKENLVKKFDLTPIQAQAILDMQLRRLAALERQKVEDELRETIKTIKSLEAILAEPKLVLAEVQKELLNLKEKYHDERLTKVLKGGVGEMTDEDLIKEEEVLLTLTDSGYIKRLPLDTYRSQGRGGRGVIGASLKEGDTIHEMHAVSTHDELLLFTNRGRVYKMRVWDIPEAGRQAKGTAVVNVIDLMPEETVSALVPLTKNDGGIKFLFMATRAGTVKKTALDQFENIRKTGIIAIKLDADDSLAWVKPSGGRDQIMLVTESGKSIRFKESQIREMGRNAAGVRGIKMGRGDRVISLDVLAEKTKNNEQLLVVCRNGFGKRTKISQYRLQNRGGSGIITAKVTKKTGPIVSAQIIDDRFAELVLTSIQGQVIRMKINDISSVGRATQGVRVMRLEDGDGVAAASIIEEEPTEETKETNGKKK
ncbi:MAG: DNA gyrase subunit A [Patescibacteria group bacterium]|nr:DNA gyrase subunit A [Patescibacteria group bacterium]